MADFIQQIDLKECLKLRKAVLWPSATLQQCMEEGDDQALHFGYVKDQNVISCLSLFYRTPTRYQIRKFATQTAYQNQGIGSYLFQNVLQELMNKQVESVYLNARITAVRFYEKFQFQAFDKEFSKNNVTFLPMELDLTQWDIKTPTIK